MSGGEYMFDLEAEMMSVLRESEDHELLETISTAKELFNECVETKKIIPTEESYITISKIFIGAIFIFLVLFLLFIQSKIYPLATFCFAISLFLIIIAIVFFVVMNVETNCWLDFLDNETIEKINQLIEKHNMKIVDTDEKMFLKKKHKKDYCFIT